MAAPRYSQWRERGSQAKGFERKCDCWLLQYLKKYAARWLVHTKVPVSQKQGLGILIRLSSPSNESDDKKIGLLRPHTSELYRKGSPELPSEQGARQPSPPLLAGSLRTWYQGHSWTLVL